MHLLLELWLELEAVRRQENDAKLEHNILVSRPHLFKTIIYI